jgi:predicted metalloendopeptidase
MGQTRRKPQKKGNKFSCYIPIQHPATKFLSSEEDADFYDYVNENWISTVKMPNFENDFSVSEEVEQCIYKKSLEILSKVASDSPLSVLKDSCLHNRIQPNNVEFLKSILSTLQCIDSKEKLVKHFAALAQSRISSIFNYQYKISPNGEVGLRLDSNICGLPISYYSDSKKMVEYKKFLDEAGDFFGINELSQIYEFEKTLVYKSEEYFSTDDHEIHGGKLPSKFPGIPWADWFENSGLVGWKKMKIYYNSPRWIRYIGKTFDRVSMGFWKLYLARIYIVHALPYLPSPYDDLNFHFFGGVINGQKEKMPKMELYVNLVYKFFTDSFSKLFWEKAGEPYLEKDLENFGKSLINAAKKRIMKTDWLEKSTKFAAIEKVSRMKMNILHPKRWNRVPEIILDPKNLLRNIYDLGNWNTNIMFSKIGSRDKVLTEGIYQVNAFYFSENNEIIIPYGTIISPFYSSSASPAWNYGALGSIIGHEMCHGFDEEGKEYSETGEKKRWWTRADNAAYKKKSAELIYLFNKQTIYGKHIHGDSTLSENIADLGGLAISLEALKSSQTSRGVVGSEALAEFREFFIAFATSWRTKYRKEKLENMLNTDSHAPAFLRVNLTVTQMEEWYQAFGVDETSPMYIPPEKRITIF